MPRPRLGQAAKDKPITVRVTEGEKNALTRAYGSPTKGLRRLIDAWKDQTKRGRSDD